MRWLGYTFTGVLVLISGVEYKIIIILIVLEYVKVIIKVLFNIKVININTTDPSTSDGN